MKEIIDILRTGDSFAAAEHIQREGSPLEIGERYAQLVMDLHWKAHDLPALVTIGRAGIFYCLGRAMDMGLPEGTREKLRSVGKEIAFNVGSFTWPGWEEPGINPSAEDMAVGRDCAKLNLRLAIELKKPARRLSAAHWLIGAHALANGDLELAEREFATAQEVVSTDDAAARELEPCNLGYLAVTKLARNPADAAALASYEQITARLRGQDDDDSKEYLSQLVRARRLFADDR